MKKIVYLMIVIACILSINILMTSPFSEKEAQADDWVSTVWTIDWTCYVPKTIGRGWVICGYDVTTEEDEVKHNSSSNHSHPQTQYKNCNGHAYTNGEDCPC